MAIKFQKFVGNEKNEIALAQKAKAWADDQGVDIVEAWFNKENTDTGDGSYIIEYQPSKEEPIPEK